MKKKVEDGFQKLKTYVNIHSTAISFVLYFSCLFWIFSFPLVSISSGESKPRSLFVDENALLVHSTMLTQIFTQNINEIMLPSSCSTRVVNISSNDELYQTVVDSHFGSKSLEATVLVFAYEQTDVKSFQAVLRLVDSLTIELQSSKWLAKRVVLLLLPVDTQVDSARHSLKLERWFIRHKYVGLIRDAYIVDLTLLSDSARSQPVNRHVEDQNISHAMNCSVATACGYLQFGHLELRHSGINGLLPNMDMVAHPLAMFGAREMNSEDSRRTHRQHRMHKKSYRDYSSVVRSDSREDLLSRCYDRLSAMSHSGHATHSDKSNDHTATAVANHFILRQVSQMILYVVDNYTPALVSAQYCRRLCGLLSSLYALLTGPTGLHAQFIERNIDAITLRAVPAIHNVHSNENANSGGEATGAAGENELLNVLFRLIYMSSNLHEELHHSLFQYVLMGSAHFVGITEYGLTCALMLLSLLLVYLPPAERSRLERVPAAVGRVLVEVAPTVLILGLLRYNKDHSEYVVKYLSGLTQHQSWSQEFVIFTLLASAHAASATACLLLCRRQSNIESSESADMTHSAVTRPTLSDDATTDVTQPLDTVPQTHLSDGEISQQTDPSAGGAEDHIKKSPHPQLPLSQQPRIQQGRNQHEEYVVVLLVCLLCLLAWILVQSFALGAAVYFSVTPSLLVAVRAMQQPTRDREVRSFGEHVWTGFLAIAHSPLGVYLTLRVIDGVLGCGGDSDTMMSCVPLLSTVRDWAQFGSLTFPALVLTHSYVSMFLLRASCGA